MHPFRNTWCVLFGISMTWDGCFLIQANHDCILPIFKATQVLGKHYVSRNFVSLCAYSVIRKTPPPPEPEENLQRPLVNHGFTGKTLTTYSVLHGDKFSHLC
nr:MAG TPA: hypothetical protein [Caudoviricetes sp.]